MWEDGPEKLARSSALGWSVWSNNHELGNCTVLLRRLWIYIAVAYLTKEVHLSSAKSPLKFNSCSAKLRLTSLVKIGHNKLLQATCVQLYATRPQNMTFWRQYSHTFLWQKFVVASLNFTKVYHMGRVYLICKSALVQETTWQWRSTKFYDTTWYNSDSTVTRGVWVWLGHNELTK